MIAEMGADKMPVPAGRITVIDALRGFLLIGICLIHAMRHFGAAGTIIELYTLRK